MIMFFSHSDFGPAKAEVNNVFVRVHSVFGNAFGRIFFLSLSSLNGFRRHTSKFRGKNMLVMKLIYF